VRGTRLPGGKRLAEYKRNEREHRRSEEMPKTWSSRRSWRRRSSPRRPRTIPATTRTCLSSGMADELGRYLADQIRTASLGLYAFAAEAAEKKGLIFGGHQVRVRPDRNNRLILMTRR